MAIWRLNRCLDESGKSRSVWYADIKSGLVGPPVKIGPRAVGWPADEVQKVNAARIAGKPEAAIRALVAQLVAARRSAA